MNPYYPHMFEPLTIKGVTFRNRVFTAPTTSHFLQSNSISPSDSYIANMVEKAKGGAACVCFGGMLMTRETGHLAIHSLFDITDPEGWRNYIKFTDAMHMHGAKASFEVIHFGNEAECPKGMEDKLTMYAASDEVTASGLRFHEMPEDVMEDLADYYAEVAACVKLCGFDVLLIHGGHGTLLQQFLSPRTNHRTDKYGGSLENRARFPMMILDRIRERVGDDLLIEYRISGSECIPGGFEIDECIEFVKMIEDKIDIIHVSAGVVREPRMRAITHPTGFLPPRPNAYLAEAVKKSGVKIPVLTLGSFQDPALIEQTLAEGKADIVAMARGFIADPQTVNKAREGRANDITPCIKCFHCLDDFKKTNYFSCAVNPMAGRETFIPLVALQNPTPKKVAVIGGGPAGMEAAIVASQRGHAVTLYEKSAALAGQLNDADIMNFKYDLRKFKEYIIAKTHEANVTLKTSVCATPEMIQKEGYDVVIAAVGAKPILPPIPGVDSKSVMLAVESYYHFDKVGQNIVVVGGGQVGCETAVHYAMMGKKVTLIEMRGELAADAQRTYREELIGQVYDRCQVVLSAACSRIEDDAIYYIDADKQEQKLNVDTVLISVGMRSCGQEAEAFREAAPRFIKIGDCGKVGTVKTAMRSAFDAAMSI